MKYNSFLGIATIRIFATGVTLSANTDIRDIVVLPEKFKSNSCFFHGQALNENWKPLNNHLYFSIDINKGIIIRSNTALSNAVIVDAFFVYPGYWWITS